MGYFLTLLQGLLCRLDNWRFVSKHEQLEHGHSCQARNMWAVLCLTRTKETMGDKASPNNVKLDEWTS